ncbi:MAG: tetratricopeptide repeat protein [Verrucomicrobia bacterium]|nr:tetratricopeptide repeat protein [Verrucomicrobiota bacterium]
MRRSFPYFILLAVVLLVYAPALRNGFVWDDTALILRDPLIRSPRLLLEGFGHFLFLDATAADFYRPLQRVVYTFDYLLAGFTPWVFHLTSLLVHAGAAMALYAFGKRLLAGYSGTEERKQGAAFFVALVWAVHPIHSSAVAYASGLADPLAALLGFGGLALVLAGRAIPAGLCFGMALFAKESGVFALLIGLGFAWKMARNECVLGRQRLARFGRVAVPALLLAAVYLGLRLTAEHLSPPPPEPIPFAVRPVLALRAVAEYAGLLAAPVNLHMERDVRISADGLQTLAGAVLLLGAAFWAWRADRTTRACLLAAAAAYLPVSDLFVLNATAAEHWVYIPSAFLFLALAATGLHLQRLERRFGIFAGIFAVVGFTALCCRTAWRCADWRDQATFLSATLRDGGDSSRMLGNFALEQLRRGNGEAAVQNFRAALARKPEQPFAMLGLGRALLQRGDLAQARQWLERCEKLPLVRASALVQRAELEFKGSGRDRTPLLLEAVAVNPRFWPVRKRYIADLLERGDIGKALEELRSVIDDQPFRAETWELLGRALEKAGNPALAQKAYAEADQRDVWRGNAMAKTF